MAKDPSKTEKATPHRRRKAREEGQVARSMDIPIAATLFITFLILIYYIPFATKNLIEYFHFTFSQVFNIIPSNSSQLVSLTFKSFFILIAPVFTILLIIGILANVGQFGFLLTGKPLIPKLDRINPISGLGRIFSLKTVFELIRNLLKLIVASAIAYILFIRIFKESSSLAFMPFNQELHYLIKNILIMILFFALLSIPIAIIDFLYRRYEYEENIKMSKEEVKEERKMYEGNPQIKAAIKRKQRELAMRRMMAEIPKADVVITNPTHFAVALKYDREKMYAPQVIAKGKNSVALKIIEKAKEHNVSIVQDPPLARALYDSCEIGDTIPEEFYIAVAKILAKIYKNKK
ncbi:flagellar biosynthesis protein FlhB [Hydrogenothermus marinus]|uniref:Flagellar biosynthetic protein FlhB n=1 Tax=Hydrogenothermus marinus TaxID=133270 RepID=A0A3M0BLL5_9AQUI|nr:flagellar biosynthesis protein FlhB [Hydrogenothermus marinus]RMA97476.1 flagellar biosynthetic protein FlhB [Hydrogenothermus marinus]